MSNDPVARVTVADGKYIIIWGPNTPLHALRYGEEWRDLTGDNMVLALAHEIQSLRTENLWMTVEKLQ